MAATATAKMLKLLELQAKKKSFDEKRSVGTVSAVKKESPKKPFAEVDRGTFISSMMAAAEESPKKVSNADKENNPPLSSKNARKMTKLSSISVEEKIPPASVCVSTDSGWVESSTSPLERVALALKGDEYLNMSLKCEVLALKSGLTAKKFEDEEGASLENEDGDKFSTPPITPVKIAGEEDATDMLEVCTGKGGAVSAPVFDCEVGQRVDVAGSGEGVVLYIGSLPGSTSTGTWCGVSLDNANGTSDGKFMEENYFFCPERCGVFVQPQRVQMVEMSSSDVLLKMLFKGGMVSKKDLDTLSINDLQLFLQNKRLPYKLTRKKAAVAAVMKYMATKVQPKMDAAFLNVGDGQKEAMKRQENHALAVKGVDEPTSAVVGVLMQHTTIPVVEHASVPVPVAVLEQDVKALDLVKVEFVKQLRYFPPSVAGVAQKYVDKLDVVLGKWAALFAESEDLIKDFQQSEVKAEAATYILKCFGKEAFKMSESFGGVKAVLASVGSISPKVSQPAQPCKLDGAPTKPTASAQGVPAPSESAKAVSSANVRVSVPAVNPKSMTGEGRRVTIQEVKSGRNVPSGNGADGLSITTHASGVRVVSSDNQQSVMGALKSTSDAGKWYHGVVKFGRGDKGDLPWGCGEIADGSDEDFVFVLRDAYSHLKKGDKVKFQVQYHGLSLHRQQAVHILRESDAPLPQALPSKCGSKAAVSLSAPLPALTKAEVKTLEKLLGLLRAGDERLPPPALPPPARRK